MGEAAIGVLRWGAFCPYWALWILARMEVEMGILYPFRKMNNGIGMQKYIFAANT